MPCREKSSLLHPPSKFAEWILVAPFECALASRGTMNARSTGVCQH